MLIQIAEGFAKTPTTFIAQNLKVVDINGGFYFL